MRAALSWTLDQGKMRSHLMRRARARHETFPTQRLFTAEVRLAEAFFPAGEGRGPLLRRFSTRYQHCHPLRRFARSVAVLLGAFACSSSGSKVSAGGPAAGRTGAQWLPTALQPPPAANRWGPKMGVTAMMMILMMIVVMVPARMVGWTENAGCATGVVTSTAWSPHLRCRVAQAHG